MEKIKAALHIHSDKDEAIPGDGAVGNMQNPSSSSDNGPTATELWGAGNADIKQHHHSHKGDTVAAAAAETSKNYSRPISTAPRDDGPFSAARHAQEQLPPPSSAGRGDEPAIVAAELFSTNDQALPQEEKTITDTPIDDARLVKSIDPFRNEMQPSEETGPGSSFVRPATRTVGDVSAAGVPSATNRAPEGHGEAEVVAQGQGGGMVHDRVTGGGEKGL